MELPFDTRENKPVLLLSKKGERFHLNIQNQVLFLKVLPFLIQSDVTEAKYFATPLVLGPNGVEKNLGLGTLTDFDFERVRID